MNRRSFLKGVVVAPAIVLLPPVSAHGGKTRSIIEASAAQAEINRRQSAIVHYFGNLSPAVKKVYAKKLWNDDRDQSFFMRGARW